MKYKIKSCFVSVDNLMSLNSRHLVLFVFIATFGVYVSGLFLPLQFDDKSALAQNGYVHDLKHIPKFFTKTSSDSSGKFTRMWRPFTMTTFALGWTITNKPVFTNRLIQVMLHALMSCVVFFLLLEIFKPMNRAGLWAMFGALLYGLHPLTSQTVLLIWKRSGLLSSLFCVSSLYFFLRTKGWIKIVLTSFLFVLGLMSKEDAIVLPALMMVLYFCLPDRSDQRNRAYSIVVSSMIAILYALFWIFWISNDGVLSSDVHSSPSIAPFSYALTQVKAVYKTLLLMLFPLHLNIDHHLHAAQLFTYESLLPIICLTCLLVILTYLSLKNRRIAIGSMFLFIPFIPFFAFSLPIAMDEARAYFSLIGFVMIVVSLFEYWTNKAQSRYFVWFAFVILSLMVIRTIFRIEVFKDARSLWMDSLKHDFSNVRARNGLCLAFVDNNEAKRALSIAEGTVKMAPTSAAAWFALARVKDALKDQQANVYYEETLRLDPNQVDAWNNYGAWFADQKKWDEAIEKFNRALMINPEHQIAKANLALAKKLK